MGLMDRIYGELLTLRPGMHGGRVRGSHKRYKDARSHQRRLRKRGDKTADVLYDWNKKLFDVTGW